MMKEIIYLSFNPGKANWSRADRILAKFDIKDFEHDDRTTGMYWLRFKKGDKTLDKLITELKKEIPDIVLSTREERVYTKKEIESAELLHLTITAYCGSGYNVYGTVFDKSNVCPVCGAGEVQESDLIIDKKEMGKKDIAITYNFEIVISERLAKILMENELSGYELRPVHHYTDKMRNEPKLFQLIITNTLPPIMVPPTKIEKSKRYCTKCGKNGLFFRSELYYARKDLKEIQDFNKTWEFTGERTARIIPGQEFIISQRAYRVLRENKIRNIKVEPVQIIEGGGK